MSLLLTNNASPGSSDGMMPGFPVEEGGGGMEKLVIVAISLILLNFLSMDRKQVTVRFVFDFHDFVYIRNISVISVENALCLKTVRLITTSDHIGLKRRHVYCVTAGN